MKLDLPTAQFMPGTRVKVDTRGALGHCRAPHYLRGIEGKIVEILGSYKDPERLAYHKPGFPALPLYKVRFEQRHIWPNYRSAGNDDLEADLYENWLVPVQS